MITDPQGTVLALFLVFCRIGGCVLALPGFSSARVPEQLRVFIAAALSIAVMPLLWDTVYPAVHTGAGTYIGLIFSESLIGVMYGMLARIYTLGMQFAASILATMVGYTQPGSADIIEDTPETSLSSFVTFAGIMILFIMDFHHIVFRALIDSYTTMPFGGLVHMRSTLISFTDTLEQTTYIMLRLSSPFLIYGLIFNVSIGFINKLAPQIPVYFISTPYLLLGGLFLIYFSIAAMVSQFAQSFDSIYIGR
ncbi:flagellar biosynthetic protein FliR [Rhizobium pisi]|uniref:Flagellar biosynthetic protein FliR n=2 Tax=Rhizobium TaxID=379 RepID=A0A7W6BF49_9HYPH|nr:MULTISPECIES: flagellar biosynthetic protein FliR [Rhizobium]MBB3132345.1 flagellar biosynthetic protein FliR [Rhizobium pisi]MBB3919134.1 flagellar biosynthetic protein FliR [Rhizobium fabae]RSB86780.1 flagellar type III secretion system protein FliR [Rhizobium pisi]RUM06940.1 flagellar type III secretion system protein FliR [Rhizobium fabae]TCA62759.1 flagellar type III secretion system protein FliR [Rhizobium pisi]